MGSPAVSIVMAACNGEPFIADAIGSVLAQGFADWELIVVDDGSTDGTAAAVTRVRDPRIALLRLPVNGGVAGARAIGFAAARGRYVAMLDCDDLWRARKLERQVRCLDAHADVVLLATAADRLVGRRLHRAGPPRRTSPASLDWWLRVRNPLVWSSVMVRAELLRRLEPPVRAERTGAEDFDLYHRLRRFGRVARIDAALTIYRDHSAGASKVMRERVVTATAAVFTDLYGPLFGANAELRAMLMARHSALADAVPDRATLALLAETIVRLRDDLLTRMPPPEHAAIRDAAAASWWRLARTLVAGGSRPLPTAPPELGRFRIPPAECARASARGAWRRLFTKAH